MSEGFGRVATHPVLAIGSDNFICSQFRRDVHARATSYSREWLGVFPQRNVGKEVKCIERLLYAAVEVYADKEEGLCAELKLLLRTADEHGVDIIDCSPRGSVVKRFLQWELRSLSTRTE